MKIGDGDNGQVASPAGKTKFFLVNDKPTGLNPEGVGNEAGANREK